MTKVKFNELLNELRVFGCDQNVLVRPADDGNGFIVIDGEHRFKGCQIVGIDPVPCSVKNITERDAKVMTMRRNHIRGESDHSMVGRLLVDLVDDPADQKMMLEKMALDEREQKAILKNLNGGQGMTGVEIKPTTDKMIETIKDTTAILSELLEAGGVLAEGFCAFVWQGQPVSVVSMDKRLSKQLEAIKTAVRVRNLNLTNILTEILDEAYKRVSKED